MKFPLHINRIIRDSAKKLGIKPIPSLNDYFGVQEDTTFSEYRLVYIKKKSGKTRQLSIPVDSLKNVQLCIKLFLEERFCPEDCVNGFVVGRSIISNAQKHTKKNYVFNLDIKDFFGSIDAKMISEALTSEPFSLAEDDAKTLAHLCCISYMSKDSKGEFCVMSELPQGAPTSPILSNIVFKQFDEKLLSLAKRFRVDYSRYADDITFSCNTNKFEEGSKFRNCLSDIFSSQACFKINDAKTRIQAYWEKQVVTGLVVNDGVNVTRKYINEIRTLLYIWEKHGVWRARCSYVKHHRVKKGADESCDGWFMQVLFGKIMFLRMVRGDYDQLTKRFLSKFNQLSLNDYLFTNKKYLYGISLPVKSGIYYRCKESPVSFGKETYRRRVRFRSGRR